MRMAIGIFIAALAAMPALASETARPALTHWVSDNTDLPAAQVAIAGPDNIYSVERLGAAAPTGEVIALVRAEGIKVDWAGPQGFRSWDAHIIFDCKVERMRVIRSASYPEANRQGEPKAERQSADWFSPRLDEPSARLLAAACDAAYPWPLRATRAIAKASKLPIIDEPAPRRPPAAPAESATEAEPAAPAADSAAKPAAELASLPIEPPAPLVTLDAPQLVELATAEPVELPDISMAVAAAKPAVMTAAPKRRLAGLFAPFAQIATFGKRLITDGTRLAGVSHRHPNAQHALLGEEAGKKVANFARAGPNLK